MTKLRGLITSLDRYVRRFSDNRLIVFVVLTVPILLYCLGLLLTRSKIAPGDGDYITQTYEAMRISILRYHQFPWWNPWVSGGVPLFANPQFGIFSLHAPLVLFFGAVLGTKLAITLYFIIGFWGFRRLFTEVFKTPVLTATLLAYIWTFGSFLTQRASGGHYTFLLINFFPWAFLFYRKRRTDKRAWLKFALVISLMANSAAHYTTILSYLVLAIIFICEGFLIIAKKKKLISLQTNITKVDLLFWVKAGGLFILLSFYRLYFTLQYLKDYPRLENDPEKTAGIIKALFSMFGPLRQFQHTPSLPEWGWLETSAYIGICTGIAAAIVYFEFLRRRKQYKSLFSYSPLILTVLFGLFFVLGLGGFAGEYSPFILLRHLPVLSSMRVATRWFAWCSILVLFFIAAYQGRNWRRTINILLAISCVELFVYCRPYLSKPYILQTRITRGTGAPFEQKRLYDTQRYGIPYDENFTEATDNNYGQIIAGDSLIDTRWEPPFGLHTNRCSIDEGCALVLTHNADVASWSSNKIVLSRTGPGVIKLNMNPGKGWLVNNRYVFLDDKTTDPSKDFIIQDTSAKLVVQYRPHLSVDWALHKAGLTN